MQFKFSLLFFVIFRITVHAGFAQTMGGKGDEHGGKRPPAIGIITGKVLDANTKQPIEFATIAVIRQRDSTIIGGGVTDNKGVFTLTEIPFGRFKIKINFIGYKDFAYKDLVALKPPDNTRSDLGEILLAASAINLAEATVTSSKAQFVNGIDKKVFTVGKDITTTGSSVSDLLASVPSVTVDIDGGVALRGSANVTILIDGKPSALMGANKADILRQLPSNSIESIELITNPSAKYDPEGVSGIINIVLKKNKQKGFNGQVQAGVGTNAQYNGVNKYNTGFSLNYRTPQYNLFANYGYRDDIREGFGRFDRTVYIPNVQAVGGATTYNVAEGFQNFASNSQTTNTNASIGHNGRLGADFYLNKDNTFGVAVGINAGTRLQDEFTKFREDTVFNNAQKMTSRYNERTIRNATKNFGYDGNLNFKHQFAQAKQELTADITYSRNENNTTGNYTPDTSIYQFAVLQKHLVGKEFQGTVSTNHVLTAQTDYTQPMKDGAKLEAGYRYTNRAIDSDLLFESSKGSLENLVVNTGRSNRFLYAEQIHAAYGTYTNTLSFLPKLGYQIGLRVENTAVLGYLVNTNTPFTQNYFTPFPSGNLNYKLTETSDLRLSFSRRIRRPNMEEVNPFPEYDNPTILRTGNPAIKPEFTNAYELGYLKNWEKHSVALTAYMRRTENQIQRFIVVTPADSAKHTPLLSNVTFINYDFRTNYGVEAVIKNEWFKWWNTMTTLNGFQTEINTGAENGGVSNAGLGFSARLQSNMTLPKGFTVQLTGNYNAPMLMAQGYFIGMSSADIGVKKDFLKGLLNVSLGVSDVFDSQRFEVHTQGSRFSVANDAPILIFKQDAVRKRETRIINLTASFRFGNIKPDASRKRRENSDGGMPSDGGGGL
ncbi:MAG: hypothetical protein RI894_2179 [Bacteroidota bacterium]